MPVIEREVKVTWIKKERLHEFPTFSPSVEARSILYQIPELPIGMPHEYENKKPEVDWTPHKDRPDDDFGRLWVYRKRPEPEDLEE